jgi:hypothetical protein
MTEDETPSNREKKVAGRARRRRYRQGTRSYLHAMTNSVARRAREKASPDDERTKK